jgi:hypothetical protein
MSIIYNTMLFAQVGWFWPVDQPKKSQIPKLIKTVRQLVNGSAIERQWAYRLIEDHLEAKLILNNITCYQSLFINNSDSDEILAISVNVIDLFFSEEKPLPKCKANAYFPVNLKFPITSFDQYEWQSRHSLFSDAVFFGWTFTETDNLDIDLFMGDYWDMECILLDSNETNL